MAAAALRNSHSHIARNPPRHSSLTLVVTAQERPIAPASDLLPAWGMLAFEGNTAAFDADALLFPDAS